MAIDAGGHDPADAARPGCFTTQRADVHASERVYLARRRALQTGAGLMPTVADDNLWGFCLSGGGVRSATFSLGVLQALIAQGALRRFDYMSTVSGGGYAGSCLTSLLSDPPRDEQGRRRRSPAASGGRASSRPESDHATPTDRPPLGLDPDTSPFVVLDALAPDVAMPDTPRLGVRHQLHHLRSHGNYLAPRGSSWLTRDVQRAVGTIASGLLHHALMFVVTLVAVVSACMVLVLPFDPDGHIVPWDGRPTLAPSADGGTSLREAVAAWWDLRVIDPLEPIVHHVADARVFGLDLITVLVLVAALGALWCLAWTLRAGHVTKSDNMALRMPTPTTRSGFDAQDDRERRFTLCFNAWSVALALVTASVVAYALALDDGMRSHAPSAFLVPAALGLGGLLPGLFGVNWLRSWDRPLRARRSLLATIQGASVYGFVGALFAPLVLNLLFSLDSHGGFPWDKTFAALLSFGGARWLARGDGSTRGGIPPRWRARLLDVLVLLAVTVAFSLVAEALVSWLPAPDPSHDVPGRLAILGVTFAAACAALVLLGTAFDSNMLSPHYFYRDRLTEAYLYTTAEVDRGAQGDEQGRPRYPLRDSESLELHEMGEGNGRAPYHILVTALNLRGSTELTRKTMLSAHFEFAKEWTGSDVTGWVRTAEYRGGETKLARAMTISAAAAGSAAGFHTTAAWAFVLTLFNARLGYWMENPWSYRHAADGTSSPPRRRLRFWPWYLGHELVGNLDARGPLVNLSDGGHTGDNLGLLPLLLRRCAVVLVVDAEADGGYTFQSFNDAVRMAYIEEDIEVRIDLGPLRPGADRRSAQSWQLGTIHYPPTKDRGAWSGTLLYLKSSLSGDLPVHVVNYAAAHDTFPHESTADQFFDDAQFESYRALGRHVADQAADALRRLAARESNVAGVG